jgi:GT2 family glycosyltransferase
VVTPEEAATPEEATPEEAVKLGEAVKPGDVDVVVVAYGAVELLDRCLAPLAGRLRLTVVDNSSDPAVEAVAERHGAVYIDPGRNLGFGAGVNMALAQRTSHGDVLLLNPDATITPDAVARLHQHLLSATDLACVAPAQVDPESGEEARVGWPFPTPMRAWLEAVGLGRLGGHTDFLIGSILLIDAKALADVGRFDERFFLYAEETDWQRRAHELGWRVRLCRDATATHVGAGTGGARLDRDTRFHASNERYMRKHYGTVGWWVFRTGVLSGSLLRALFLPGERGREAATRFHLYLKGPLRAEADMVGS